MKNTNKGNGGIIAGIIGGIAAIGAATFATLKDRRRHSPAPSSRRPSFQQSPQNLHLYQYGYVRAK